MNPVIFGEVLFDCFPDGNRVLGGAPFNVAWHLQAFGKKPFLVSGVGDDPPGNSILKAMQNWEMRTDGVIVDRQRATGTVEVAVHHGEPSYDIVDDRAWDLAALPSVTLPPEMLLYHGSLALRHRPARDCVAALKQQAQLVFVDINLRPPWYSKEQVLALIHNIDWLKLNEHELLELVDSRTSTQDRLKELHETSEISKIVVTRGGEGALLSVSGKPVVTVPLMVADRLVDTVGAGDAFSAVLILGIIRGWDYERMMRRAQQFAASIVGVQGATVDEVNFYEGFLASWMSPAEQAPILQKTTD